MKTLTGSLSPTTDLLPPIFDQILLHYENTSVCPYARVDIVRGVLNDIVHAVAENAREQLRRGNTATPPLLTTTDRLSGTHLSRGDMITRIRTIVPLTTSMIEIALLLVEVQIDLALENNGHLKIGDITFRPSEECKVDTSWCRQILQPAMNGISHDAPTINSYIMRRHPEGLRILMEGLQLSATLRRAVPYSIEVDPH